MLTVLVMMYLISFEVQQNLAFPISVYSPHYRSNSTPAVTHRIRKKLEKKFNDSHLSEDMNSFQQENKNTFHRSKTGDLEMRGDRIIFIDEENESKVEEGSLCQRSVDGANGYCLLSTQCRHVMDEFKAFGTKIDVCGYDGSMPLICCPLGSRQKINGRKRTRKRPSERYCDEYSKLTQIRNTFARLTATPTLLEIESEPQCHLPIPLIVGGESAVPGEFPHMAAIGWTRSDNSIKWSCGGSLISDKFILTAAHCVRLAGSPPDIVRLGAHDLNAINPKNSQIQDIRIKKIITHPKYDVSSYYNDIALIQLVRSVKFNLFTRPACLWQSSTLNVEKVTATGWGRLGFHGRKADNLQKVNLDLIDRETCNESFPPQQELDSGIIKSQICAGYMEGGKDTCQGDSGGPLQISLPGNRCTHYIVGITSFGKFCAAPNMPGVYTNIYSYLDWIEDNVFRIVV